MGHQSYVLLWTEITLSNHPEVFPKSSCDVHLLRSPWISKYTTIFNEDVNSKVRCSDVSFLPFFLILLLSTYCHELWPLFRLCKNCNADNSVPLKYLSKYCYIYFISLADNIGLHARLKFDRATTWQYFQKGVL